MKKIFYPWLLVAVLLLPQCKTTSRQTSTPPTATTDPTAQPKEKTYTYTTAPGDSLKARIYKLDNGLTVYLTDYKDAPRIQTYIAVRAGSKNDPATATGLAHYLEHMVFKGTSRLGSLDYAKEKPELDKIEQLYELYRSKKDAVERKKIYHQIDSVSGVAAKYAIANEYDKILASIGGSGSNAYTSVEQTVYTGDIPANQLEKWAMVEAERFGEMVPRLFHTELEAVYEEKNRTLDSDGRKVFTAMLEGLFPTHQYGTQTTIGTIEHLKNPSITEIKKYFDAYYVPNNMAIAMSGDLDPDQTIRIIDKYFGKLKSKPLPTYTSPAEAPIAKPVVKEVLGPNAESMMLGFRFPGVTTREALVLEMISQILANGQAGLIDLNLNQKQVVLEASSFDYTMNDYSANLLSGTPRQGQTLEQVKDLLLSQVNLVKQGKFEDWLIPAIINNNKMALMKSYESNEARADAFVSAFVARQDWKDYIQRDKDFAGITKQEVMQVANKFYGNNYVVVYKRIGKDPNMQKVEKPTITPVSVNRDAQSDFYKQVMAGKTTELQPVFVDYKKDISEVKLKQNIPLYYTRNKENGLFNLYYILETGTNNNLKLGLAVNYLKYLGNDKFSAEELQKEFYKLGCSFDVFTSQEQVYVSLSGLDANFEKGLTLFESVLQNPKSDQQALTDLIAGILKERADAKRNKSTIHSVAMVNYAKYGPKNPFTNIIPENQLKKVKPQELVDLIKTIPTYEHHVLYYGPRLAENLTTILNTNHIVPATLKPVPPLKVFQERDIAERQVYWTDYNMVQAELIFLTKSFNFDAKQVPTITLYNEYFGGNMGSIVFQELRESKALAYSASSRYANASRKDRANYILSYIGTQSDKLPEAMEGMQTLLNDMPQAEANFANAKESIRNSIATERITKSSILFDYERAKRLGIDYDIRQDVYQNINAMTFDDMKKFQQQFIKGQNQMILVIGSKDRLNFKELSKYGKVKQLSLKELFGY
ncbi:M16 family metallopeptidase [Adhaeribacter radiodurans]|uniref:Insulinase family protein n=1 Tax=Adhaeribacter radiodurans TaxID=2745197 RepID=A0A7L7L4K8_9BACT|nr:insulinase family protein [Adhaeribacter radiodurans]QMU27737.1 insulinase family protein [Adhaeribacter radiodurans]